MVISLLLSVLDIKVGATRNDMGAEIAAQVNREGIVLLKNENGALPLKNGEKIAVFGEGQADLFDASLSTLTKQRGYIPFGAGSAWSLNDEAPIAPIDALREYASNGKISIYEEISKKYEKDPDYTPTEADIKAAASNADTAIIVISRWGGECRDFSKDAWDASSEAKLIEQLRASFGKVIAVLNTGSAIDTSWDESVDAMLFTCYGGRQGGKALAEIIIGDVDPSGKLAFTWAKRLEDYPTTETFLNDRQYQKYTEDIYLGYRYFDTVPNAADKVKYSFGYGLSYTDFSIEPSVETNDGKVVVKAKVTNIGDVAGKEVIEVYFSAPQGVLGKASRVLCAFGKTDLLAPGANQTLMLEFSVDDMASYDDAGKTGNASSYVLEAGDYKIFVGNSLVNSVEAGKVTLDSLRVVKKLSPQMITNLDKRMKSDGTLETIDAMEKTQTSVKTESASPSVSQTTVRPLSSVLDGSITLDEFAAQMTTDELATFFVSYPGNKAGTSDSVAAKYWLTQFSMHDSSQGIGAGSTSYPCETIMASTWNLRLAAAYALSISSEAYTSQADMILTPAVNLQRNPLAGRNFEYYSEDPYLSGSFAVEVIKNIQSLGVGTCVKHFVCNETETNKLASDSRVSERALRELYLKPFEMAVTKALPWGVMSSYNLINGVPASENGDLLINILRGEWGFEGFVTGDWNNDKNAVKEINNGNNVREPANFCDINSIIKAINSGKITRRTLETGAKQVLYVIMRSQSYSKMNVACGGNHNFENGICTKCYQPDPSVLANVNTKIGDFLSDVHENEAPVNEISRRHFAWVIPTVIGSAFVAIGAAAAVVFKKRRKV